MPQTPHFITEALQMYRSHCSGLNGAAIATPDGKLVGSVGYLPSAQTALAAARLALALKPTMRLIHAIALTKALLWSPPVIWYWAQLGERHVLLGCTKDELQAGALRLAGQIVVQHLLSHQLDKEAWSVRALAKSPI